MRGARIQRALSQSFLRFLVSLYANLECMIPEPCVSHTHTHVPLFTLPTTGLIQVKLTYHKPVLCLQTNIFIGNYIMLLLIPESSDVKHELSCSP